MATTLTSTPPPPDFSWHKRGITNLTVTVPSSFKSSLEASREPARWRTPEFLVYGVVFLFALPYIFKSVIDLSQSSHPNYPLYQHHLSQGWLFGRQADTSDAQYRSFRSHFLALCLLAFIHLAGSHLHTNLSKKSTLSLNRHLDLNFSAIFSVIMITALHGTSAIKILLILSLNYHIAKRSSGRPEGAALTWIFNITVLFGNEIYDGYKFGSINSSLRWMDNISGFYPRWNVTFNITMLRLVSFYFDYHWSSNKRESRDSPATLSERSRVTTAHPEEMYNFRNYVAYVLYPPLYIAGPIMTFNDFMWQVRRPIDIPVSVRIGYLARFIVSMLSMEFLMHFMYVVAIKDAEAWAGNSPFELAMIGFWNLMFMWLKLLIPWRFFRLWALWGGIDPQENMVRCVANNYSTQGFWRSWHRSYNLWLVRYIYAPVSGPRGTGGGIVRAILPKLLVFTFVALWHDLTLRLLVWGWLISLFILPEICATRLIPESKYGNEWWYRHLCALGGALNIMMMMSANLVGFVLGTSGMAYLAKQLFTSWAGWQFIVIALPCLFVGVQVMFEYREEEKRRGIIRKC